MSRRERLWLVLGIIGAIGVVVYPLAHRMSTRQDGAIAAQTVSPSPPARTPTPARTANPAPSRSERPVFSWIAEATEHRGAIGESFVYVCSPNGILGAIWGSDIYTDDSSVCTAGVHRGVITREQGGTVTIIIRPALASYEGSTRNGVTTEPYGPWDGSYEVVAP